MINRKIKRVLVMALAILVSVGFIMQYSIPSSAVVKKYSNLGINDQVIAVRYARLLYQCIKNYGVSATIDSSTLGNMTYVSIVNQNNSTQYPVSYLIEPHDGKATCAEITGSVVNPTRPLTGGNAFKFLGLDTLSVKSLLTDVFGYTQSTGSAGGVTSYTLKATGIEYYDGDTRRTNGTVTRTVEIPYSFEDYDYLYGKEGMGVGCEFCVWDSTTLAGDGSPLYNQDYYSGSVDENQLKQRFVEFMYYWNLSGGVGYNKYAYNDMRMQLYMSANGNETDGYIEYDFRTDDGYEFFGAYDDLFDLNDPPSVTLTKGSTTSDNPNYDASSDPSGDFNMYITKNIFGLSAQPGFIDFWWFTAAGYYYYYSQLISTSICNAKIIEKEDPETRSRYDSSQNAYFANVTVVADSSRKAMYADWSDQSKEYEFTNVAKLTKDIPVGSIYDEAQHSAEYIDCAEMAARMTYFAGKLSDNQLNDPKIQLDSSTIYDPQEPDTPEPGVEEPPPADTCNAGVLGWILCPVIEILGSALDGLYTLIIEPFLVIQADLVPQSGGTFDAWDTFRSMANIIFIIFILVVVFSQITGIGVTNYGIKKILPKIIICALLVNLSYYICQLAVDISNIIGNQLHEMLSSFGGGLTYINPSNDTVVEASAIWATLGGIAAVGIGGIAVAASIGTILIALLAGLVSLLMMFLILAARKVAVVVLIALSPLAFVCFLLPNTEKLFKKWFDILKTMLLVYPICGLLIGAGHMAASIISKIDHQFFTQLAGALASILPYFFVPTLIKGSLNAFGSVGAKLSGLTGRISKGTRDRLDSSTLGKAASARDTAFKNKRFTNPKSLRNRTLGRLYGSKFGKRFGLDRAYSGVQAGAIAGQKRAEKEEFDAQMMLLASQTNNGDLGMLRNEYTRARDSGDETRARAALELAGSQGAFGAGQASKWVKDSATAFRNNPSMRNAVAKQIATGASSANFRKADAMTWQYANAVNSGAKTKAGNELLPDNNWYNGTAELDTKDSNGKNITSEDQLRAVVTDGKALQDLSTNALRSIWDASTGKGMNQVEIDYYASLAEKAYTFYQKGTFQPDETKTKYLNDILKRGKKTVQF